MANEVQYIGLMENSREEHDHDVSLIEADANRQFSASKEEWDINRIPVEALKTRLTRAQAIDFRLNAARVMGGFREGRELSDIERQSLALAWRNCI